MTNNVIKKALLYSLYFICLAIILYFWYINSYNLLYRGNAEMLVSLGRIAALLAVYCILLQLLLIGRIAWIEKIFGHDKLSHTHHINGLIAWILIIIHPILITSGYAILNNYSFISQLKTFISTYQFVILAVIAYLIFMITIGISINLIRRKLKYEYWISIHIFSYAAILLAFLHQIKFGGDFTSKFFIGYWYFLYAFAFGNLIIFRFIIPLYNFNKYQFKLDKIVKENHSVNSLYFKGNNLEKLKIKPGQFMIFRLLKKGLWNQAHPFTVSKKLDNEIRISVKASGDFSSGVDKIPLGTKVLIEGPYGTFTEDLAEKDKLLFIAGGIGITPIRSIIESANEKNKDMILLYSNKTSKDITFKSELEKLANKNNKLKIIHIITEDEKYKGEKRRINIQVIREYISDLEERDIYICGPKEMMKAIIKELKNAGIKRKHIHFEKFSLG